ncbi:MAG: glycerol-3-phosphate dehydrogenase [Acidobacteria bacterium 13_1_20CM_2_55_15]|nr:MAG: glycerol-3-phosphate dehydrogenase [Acidobacteria bacterium 13_1_40CM_56_16]OLD67933.1 MAG: glycerol-3-phosphate dehydrogenase [Acidobacteria bacterium 13_1_40CM_2_56_11]OLE88680.1 MAG: glycerol-3-phosphate dehydrogenase [Acidobacteria bacterium 13_1_20CM_2_55_15]
MARLERDVRLWVYEPYLVETMIATGENPIYLPSVRIPPSVRVSNSVEEVLAGVRIVILAVPSHVYRQVFSHILPLLNGDMWFVSATKGIENETLMRMSEVIADVARPRFVPCIAAISGPTFALEVARGEPTALVVASPDESLRLYLQRELSAPRFRLYTNPDLIGVEISAAVKNIIAIAAGVVEGLGLGSNPAAALITRGLAEMTRLVVACGGRRETLSGLAGLGDLVLTAYGSLSRNRRVGVALGQGKNIDDVLSSTRMVAEGVKTAKSTVALARKLDVEMPIAEKMYAVLYEGLKPQDAIDDLMERKLREE